MAPKYKLTYFSWRGRGETARMLFKLAGKDFEDIRLDNDKWEKLKPNVPWNQLPVLEVDKTVICQSNAINRYLAREFGFAGKDSLAMARADMLVDCIEEASAKLGPIFAAKNDTDKAAAAKTFKEETVEPNLAKLEKLLQENNGGNDYFVGKDLTWADLSFLNMGGLHVTVSGADLGKYPKLKALKEKVEKNPKIAAWIKARPDTPM